MKAIDQRLFQARRAGERDARQYTAIQAEGDGRHACEHQHAQCPADPRFSVERTLESGEHPPAGEHGYS